MTSGGEIIGDIAQGAMLSRAAEPEHGEAGDDGHTHESACLNCGTGLIGSHCHACGQAAHVHRTLGAFFHDLLHGVFHFEGKIWRTLPLLWLNPGRLTREWVEGKRTRYVSPLAIFLLTVAAGFGGVIAFSSPGELPRLLAGDAGGGDRVALQGNLDPNVLFAPPQVVREQAIATLDSFGLPQRADGRWDGHVFNLGHGISQYTPPEHVSVLVDAVHQHSRRLRATA